MRRLPKLPRELFSLLGPVPIVPLDPVRAEQEELYGRFLLQERRIEITQGMDRAIEWATLWHEATHVILTDSGANNSLSETQCEIICDAVGTYLTAMMQAGQLTVPTTRTPRNRNDARTP